MASFKNQFVRALAAGMLALVFMIPQDALAQNHVVSPSELQSAAVASTEARQHNLDTLQQFVSTPM